MDCLKGMREMPDNIVQTTVTSPPYWNLRDYGDDAAVMEFSDGWVGALGLEPSVLMYIDHLVEIFTELYRVTKDNGTAWINIGDTYASARKDRTNKHVLGDRSEAFWRKNPQLANRKQQNTITDGLKPKDLALIPFRLAIALQDIGWYVRSDIIWHKPNPTPESCTDRPSKAHEYIFLLSKNKTYYYNASAIRTVYADKTRTTWGIKRTGRGDGSGLVKSENLANSIKERKPYKFPGQWASGKEEHTAISHNKKRSRGTGKKKRGHPQKQEGLKKLDKATKFEQQIKGANKKTVWTVSPEPYKDTHFAIFPKRLIEPCVLAGSDCGDLVFDPFMGRGTTAVVACLNNRAYLGFDLVKSYKPVRDRYMHKELGLLDPGINNR